jgi:hypothetical protein
MAETPVAVSGWQVCPTHTRCHVDRDLFPARASLAARSETATPVTISSWVLTGERANEEGIGIGEFRKTMSILLGTDIATDGILWGRRL